jgi:hypothetical protein
MTEKPQKAGWVARNRVRRREKRERTGDSPEKQGEHKRGAEPTVKDALNRAGTAGFLSGGV